MNKKILDFLRSFLMWFLIFYLIMWGYESFFKPKEVVETTTEKELIKIESSSDSFVKGNLATFDLINQSDKTFSFSSPCEKENSLEVYRLVNGKRVLISDFSDCNSRKISDFTLLPQTEHRFDLPDFNIDFFNEEGEYFISITLQTETEDLRLESNSFDIENPGFFRRLFRALISQPLFNLLTWFTTILPNNSLGWAIVLLTILVRVLLFLPNQKAMKSQREMQKLQPKIAELKTKYGKNQQMLAMKTMELYKTHKVSPMSSCLPMLIQLPVMLGLYYIIQDGLSLHLSYLFYSFNSGADLTIVDSHFAGIDLALIPWAEFNFANISSTWLYIFLPIFVGLTQFVAVRMSMIQAKKRKNSETKKPVSKTEKPNIQDQMQKMTGTMLYVMPAMICFFTATFPAAVGIYWLTSTVFGIIQQKLVNYQLDKPQIRVKVD